MALADIGTGMHQALLERRDREIKMQELARQAQLQQQAAELDQQKFQEQIRARKAIESQTAQQLAGQEQDRSFRRADTLAGQLQPGPIQPDAARQLQQGGLGGRVTETPGTLGSEQIAGFAQAPTQPGGGFTGGAIRTTSPGTPDQFALAPTFAQTADQQEAERRAAADQVTAADRAADNARAEEALQLQRDQFGLTERSINSQIAARGAAGQTAQAEPPPGLSAERMQVLLGALDRAVPLIGVASAGVLGNALSAFNLSQPGVDLRVELETAKGLVAVETLQALRAASTSGASGFGQLTEKELALLERSRGSLEQAQSPDALRRTIAEIRGVYAKLLNDITSATAGSQIQTGVNAPTDLVEAEFNRRYGGR